MSFSRHRLIQYGTLLCELITLAMFCSATLLTPIPFGGIRISAIAATAFISCLFAYISSSQFKNPDDASRLRLTRLIVKPPFVIWLTVFAIIAFLLGSELLELYLSSRP